MSNQSTIREEELKNRVAAAYFGKDAHGVML